jgi:hypothetical protein
MAAETGKSRELEERPGLGPDPRFLWCDDMAGEFCAAGATRFCADFVSL